MLAKFIASMTGISVLMLIILFLTTTPASTGPLGILGFFVFMYLAALGVLTFLFHASSLLLSKFMPKGPTKFKIREVTLRKAYYYASVITLVPIMFIAIHSVGEVGIYQVLLIFFFAVIAWIYVSNRST